MKNKLSRYSIAITSVLFSTSALAASGFASGNMGWVVGGLAIAGVIGGAIAASSSSSNSGPLVC